MVFGIGSAIAAATGVVGGAVGRHDAAKAASENRSNMGKAIHHQWLGRADITEGINASRPYFEDILGVASSIEDDLLGQIDPVTAGEMRRIRQERQAQQAQMQQQMAQGGLDSFTTRYGAQASLDGQASNALNASAMRSAGLRTSAISAGRNAEMSALARLGSFEMQAGQARAQSMNAISQIFAGTQVNAPNTAAGIGALGNSFMEGYRTDILNQALNQAGPGPSPLGGSQPFRSF